MIFLVDGLPGSGKSFFITDFLESRWKIGQRVAPNWNVYFSDDGEGVERWRDFDEVLAFSGGEKGGIIGVDEAYKVFDCRRSLSLPIAFSEKIAEHRHHGLDLITATQNFSDLDKRVRDKVEVWFHCKSIIRYPYQQTIAPLFQWIIVYERRRHIKNDRTVWRNTKKYNYYISRLWTKKKYDTLDNLKLSQYIARLVQKKGRWVMRIASRAAINRGRVRGF